MVFIGLAVFPSENNVAILASCCLLTISCLKCVLFWHKHQSINVSSLLNALCCEDNIPISSRLAHRDYLLWSKSWWHPSVFLQGTARVVIWGGAPLEAERELVDLRLHVQLPRGAVETAGILEVHQKDLLKWLRGNSVSWITKPHDKTPRKIHCIGMRTVTQLE